MKALKFLLMMVLVMAATFCFAQDATEQDPELNIFKFIGNADWINVALVAAFSLTTTIGGVAIKVIANRSRETILKIGEICIKFYEYTGDKVLDSKEREDLKNRFVELVGPKLARFFMSKLEGINPDIDPKPLPRKNKRKQQIKIEGKCPTE